MKTYRFDVVIIGAGPAGVAAAGSLAGSGLSIALIESGIYAGAENWSGCVYFSENLSDPDCFGPAAVQNAPFERQVVRRGTLMHNGLDEVGLALTDAAAFRHCYTVLRPLYDPYFVDLARSRGVTVLTDTTVTSLIRKSGRVIGVSTDRGPLYSEVVFLAEGDASHLVRSENLERVREPHYLQGVKAVLSLPVAEIEQRFDLNQGEGAAYEILIRNGAIAGRTAKLNMGGFLYTNRDSLSIGCVVPLDNLKKHFRGDHSRLLEWMRGLPFLRDLVRDGALTSYGTKIIRSGGWRERPVLVEDGLAVGGASTGLGIDIPFPNFTGPASASGLFFGRAVKSLLKQGRSLNAQNLKQAYLRPLEQSVYGKNARHLSRWPSYFSRSSVLFGRTVDMACGGSRFLSSGSRLETARFLRGHILSLRGLRELGMDTIAALRSLRLGKPLIATLLHPTTIGSWFVNAVKRPPSPDPRLRIIMNIRNGKADPRSLPWPFPGMLERTGPALASALAAVYTNDDVPIEKKFSFALKSLLRSLSIIDLLALPWFGFILFILGIATAAIDAFRFFVMKVPVEKLLAEPVMAYGSEQRKARDLDAVKPALSLEAKLGLNTYRIGSESHIRTLWPDAIRSHAAMAKAGLWWVCPARVYTYEAPLFGRGRVTVNWENCIKCESCWRAEPSFALWSRFTDHKLVYRPSSSAIPLLLESRQELNASSALPALPAVIDKKIWYTSPAIVHRARTLRSATATFREALSDLPASADRTRRTWPTAMGERVCNAAETMERMLLAEGRQDAAKDLQAERLAISSRLTEGRLFHSLAAVNRLEQRLLAWIPELDRAEAPAPESEAKLPSYDDTSKLFPDRIVKQWEEEPMPQEWQDKLGTFLDENHAAGLTVIRVLSSISPALGLIAACRMRAAHLLSQAGKNALPNICAIDAEGTTITHANGVAAIKGRIAFVPQATAKTVLLVENIKGYLLPLNSPGVVITPTPAIGFRAANLCTIELDCTVNPEEIVAIPASDSSEAAYLAIALGAGDYLSRRAQEHAAGRIQFSGQMLDTEGRDGIAKLGAVKALVSRVEAWRLLLETVFKLVGKSEIRNPESAFSRFCASLAAQAFSPENGAMAYDAGQVFGGFAYSEDDLLSRFYRDSSLFPYLTPGLNASAALDGNVEKADLLEFLKGPLPPLPRAAGEPIDRIILQWNDVRVRYEKIPAAADPLLRGNAAALLLGTRALLSAVERSLGSGRSAEAEAASCEVLLGLADDAVMKAALSAGRGSVSPRAVFPMEPAGKAATLDLDYEGFCSLGGRPHRSGSFLLSVFDRSGRYVPEMQLHDPVLRQRWQELVDWFRTNCRDKSFNGLSFERHVEQRHNLPPEIIESVKAHKWLATYVPQAEDGLGWRKAGYYALNSAAGSFGDAGVCLLIMASTSIGTTPILLGLHEELPRVREELEPLVRNEKPLKEIGSRLHRLIASFKSPNPGWIQKEYEAIMKLVDSRIRKTRVVKYLAANFLRPFYGAGLAGQRGDFGGFMTNLEKAANLFDHLLPDVRTALEELPRRERCHRLYLRTLGHGGVSAFALTEPTAGSDSGGVKTTALLTAAMLSAMPDGRYAFSPTGEIDKCRRFLIDADRIVFTDEGMAYRAPDDSMAVIRYDRYDHATSTGIRSYEYQGAVCEFHDIGQVRQTATGLVYEYYSLTGSKMWITNGSVATQFSLFAQAPEGVTGFMVDRYAEGLTVGADEKKTGQRGSPTNELALDSVRVAREAVIGYEGHGQVNALETLNVGRCGLAAVAGALSRKVMAEAREHIPASGSRDRLLGEAAAIQFGSESLAYYLIGLFDRPHESVRMESAIAKYLCAEDIHEVLSLVEQAFGPAGQTEKFLLEKARRDARILNIYEGTNEVQRFLILKDLIALVQDWPELPEELPEQPGDDRAMILSRWKNRVRTHVRSAALLFGDNAWSDAMLQPDLFRIAEMAGEILRLECVWYRVEWIDVRKSVLGEEYVAPLLAAGSRSAERTLARLDHLDRICGVALKRLSANILSPEVHAADALLDRTGRDAESDVAAAMHLRAPIKILCIVRPAAELPPSPILDNGRLREILWQADPGDRSCVDQALYLKNSGSAAVDLLFAGGNEHDDILRAVGASADNLFKLRKETNDPADIAAAIREIEGASAYDLILCASAPADGRTGLAPFLAGRMKRSFGESTELRVQDDAIAGAPLPAIMALSPITVRSERSISSLIEAQAREIRAVGPSGTTASPVAGYTLPQVAAVETRTAVSSHDAAEFLLNYSSSRKTAQINNFTGTVPLGALPQGPAIWALLDPAEKQTNATAIHAAVLASGLFGKHAAALIAAPRTLWPVLLGTAQANGMERCYCLDTANGTLSEEGKRRLLRVLLAASESPTIFGSEEWNEIFAFIAGESREKTISLIPEVQEIKKNDNGWLDVDLPAYGGKLLRKVRIEDGAAFVTLAESAELPYPSAAEHFSAFVVDLLFGPESTGPLPPEREPTLAEAEVIIDIGYGVRDGSGLALAQELKAALETLGMRPFFGATRKVTQDLKLLPLDAQIGQTGTRVNPKLILALGISGAPQHVDYIGTRANVLCFNKDTEAPFMKLNAQRPSPKVHSIAGDLFVTIRELIEKLKRRKGTS